MYLPQSLQCLMRGIGRPSHAQCNLHAIHMSKSQEQLNIFVGFRHQKAKVAIDHYKAFTIGWNL